MEKNYNNLNIEDNNYYKIYFENEEIIFADIVNKINSLGKRQSRQLIITGKNLYDLRYKKIKNQVSLEKIKAISYSKLSSEFVIHITNSYDFRFIFIIRNDIIKCILYCLENNFERESLDIYFLDNINLNKVTTTKTLFKAKKDKKLDSNYLLKVNHNDFKQIEEKEKKKKFKKNNNEFI